MLAALLCNLETEPTLVGPILRERYASIGRDVQKAAREIQALLAPSAIPGVTKATVKRSIERIAEVAALPAVTPAEIGGALLRTQSAILSIERLLIEFAPQPWMLELRLILEQLTVISVSLNDDEEALLLLM